MKEDNNYWALKYFVPASKPKENAILENIDNSKEFYDNLLISHPPKTYIPVTPYEPKVTLKIKVPSSLAAKIQLFKFCDNGNHEECFKLLENLEDPLKVVLSTDEYGWTPLMCSIASNSYTIVELLLQYGAIKTIMYTDKGNNSALSLSNKLGNPDIINLLEKYLKTQPLSLKEPETNDDSFVGLFYCEMCKSKFANDSSHHTSITHLFHHYQQASGSNPRKYPNFIINNNNPGYKLLQSEGWDCMSGLGPNKSGRIYPLRANKKLDRSGLGFKPKKSSCLKSNKISKPFTKEDEIAFRLSFR